MFSRAVVLSFVLIFAFGPGVSANAQEAGVSAGSESPDIVDQPLLLTCTGGGTTRQNTYITKERYDSHGRRQTYQETDTVPVPFNGKVEVRLLSGKGQMKLPAAMLPLANRADDQGWLNLKNVKVTEKNITGAIDENFVSAPKFRIDRVGGTLDISGLLATFSGSCQKSDPENDKPKF
jgi:hypothetical protein